MELTELRHRTEQGMLVRSVSMNNGSRVFIVKINHDCSINLYSYLMSQQTKGWSLLSKEERLSKIEAIVQARTMV